MVGQVELCEDGVHLGVVVSRLAEALDKLTLGQTLTLSPVDDAHSNLVATLHIGVALALQAYVDTEAACICRYEYIVCRYLCSADIGSAAALHNLGYCALKFAIA